MVRGSKRSQAVDHAWFIGRNPCPERRFIRTKLRSSCGFRYVFPRAENFVSCYGTESSFWPNTVWLYWCSHGLPSQLAGAWLRASAEWVHFVQLAHRRFYGFYTFHQPLHECFRSFTTTIFETSVRLIPSFIMTASKSLVHVALIFLTPTLSNSLNDTETSWQLWHSPSTVLSFKKS